MNALLRTLHCGFSRSLGALLFAVTLLTALSGCSSVPTIYQREKEMPDKVMQYFTEDRAPDIDDNFFVFGYSGLIDFFTHKPPINTARPFLVRILIRGKPVPLGIRCELPLSLYLDDNPDPLNLPCTDVSTDPPMRIFTDPPPEDWALYALNHADMDRLAQATRVRFRLPGAKETLTGSWTGTLLGEALFFAKKAPELILMPEGTGNPPLASQTPKLNMLYLTPNAVQNFATDVIDGIFAAHDRAERRKQERKEGWEDRADRHDDHRDTTAPARLGVDYRDIRRKDGERLHVPGNVGAHIESVESGSPADRAGIRNDDIILRLGRIRIGEEGDLSSAVDHFRTGDRVSVEIWRNGQRIQREIRF